MKKEKKILIVIGTRPNFIKVTQFKKLAPQYPDLNIKFVHTSQHYSDEMSGNFFEQFGFQPDYHLNIPGNLSVVSQFSEILKQLEQIITQQFYPDLIMVVGDVNSTLAGALVANKMNIKIAHLESGLRSFDASMPEEYNRKLTDQMAHYFFVTEQDAITNLIYEGVSEKNIFYVGNTMIDTLIAYEKEINDSKVLEQFNISPKQYLLLTLHRPANVDTKIGLKQIIESIKYIFEQFKPIKNIVFPVHPRTQKNLISYGLWDETQSIPGLIITKALSYFDFQKTLKHAYAVITDSGGVQEETSYLGIPCITLRASTERPVTVWDGSNVLLPFKKENILNYLNDIEQGKLKLPAIPKYWDGKATKRILEILSNIKEI